VQDAEINTVEDDLEVSDADAEGERWMMTMTMGKELGCENTGWPGGLGK
jgi:hypothetical protein